MHASTLLGALAAVTSASAQIVQMIKVTPPGSPLVGSCVAAVAGMSGCTGQSDVFRNTLEAGDDCSNWSGSDEAVVKSICGSAWLTLYPYNGTFAFINGAGDQSSCQIIRTQLPDHNPVYLGAKCALIPGRSISEHDWFY